jgi:hypothetical protein
MRENYVLLLNCARRIDQIIAWQATNAGLYWMPYSEAVRIQSGGW